MFALILPAGGQFAVRDPQLVEPELRVREVVSDRLMGVRPEALPKGDTVFDQVPAPELETAVRVNGGLELHDVRLLARYRVASVDQRDRGAGVTSVEQSCGFGVDLL